MDEWKRLCSHAHTEGKVVSRLQDTGLLSLMKDAVTKEVVKPSVEIRGVERTVYDAVENSGKVASCPKALFLL